MLRRTRRPPDGDTFRKGPGDGKVVLSIATRGTVAAATRSAAATDSGQNQTGHQRSTHPIHRHSSTTMSTPLAPPISPSALMPRQPVPALSVPTLDHGQFTLADDAAPNFTIVVVYRGLHCPICLKYLLELGRLHAEFEQRGVKLIALSSDTRDRAQTMADKLRVPALRVGYGLDLAQARAWGLYISTSRGTTSAGIEEPALFSEPGVFIVRPDGTLYYGAVQTMPFARPHFDELLAALDFALSKNYPARGEYAGPV